MNTFVAQALVAVFTALFSLSVYGQEPRGVASETEKVNTYKFSVEVGSEAYFGYTLYQIGGTIEYPNGTRGNAWFPLSELKFPLNVFMASCDIKCEMFEKYIIHTNIKKNITTEAGKMKDSDWGVFSNNPDSLEIYSESKSKLNAFMINSDFQIRTFTDSMFSLYAGIGFLYQNFDFTISDVNQTSVNPLYQGSVHGEVLTYKLDYYIPYLEIIPCINFDDKIKITGNLAFSPYTVAHDVDDHKLRYKESKGDSTGMSFLTTLKVEFHFFPSVVFSMTLNYTYIATDGFQNQYQYKEYSDGANVYHVGPIVKIQNKIDSSQFSAGIGAGMGF